MKSISFRNFVATAMMVSISFLIVAAAFVGIGSNYVINRYRDSMVNSAREVSRMASAVAEYDSLNNWSLGMNISSISHSTGNQIFITDESGLVVSCSDRVLVCEHLGKTVPAGLMEQLHTSNFLNQISYMEDFYEGQCFVVANAVMGDSGPVGYVFVTNESENIISTWSTFLIVISIVTLSVFFAALGMSMVYSRRLARPLDEIAACSRRYARGDFSVRVNNTADQDDEMGTLIESFNKMADSLETAETRRSEFVANISHELRTPMTTIAGFADGILDGTIPRDEQEKYLLSIRDETRRLSRLVRDMLDASNARAHASDPTRRSDFDLTELILQTMLSFEDRATKKNLDVDPQLPDNHIMVNADRDAITQVIYNLMDNAVKFSKPGSCIIVRLYKDGDRACVSIKDFGETIPPEDLPFIFDRFHKSDRSRSLDKDGVGLGLSLVKAIINGHDQDIAVKSEDGMTEFVFTLKLAK